MNIFKLIFHHDQRLNELADQNFDTLPKDAGESLEDFMKPDPTYSSFYFSGTDLAKNQFGLSILTAYDMVIEALDTAFSDKHVNTVTTLLPSIHDAIPELETGEVLVLTDNADLKLDIASLHIDEGSNADNHKSKLKTALEDGHIVVYKEQAVNGFNLRMFSKKNVYREIFFPLQKLVPDHFRFFSINGKKVRSERHSYFETWTLDRPPHGFEEVHPETVL